MSWNIDTEISFELGKTITEENGILIKTTTFSTSKRGKLFSLSKLVRGESELPICSHIGNYDTIVNHLLKKGVNSHLCPECDKIGPPFPREKNIFRQRREEERMRLLHVVDPVIKTDIENYHSWLKGQYKFKIREIDPNTLTQQKISDLALLFIGEKRDIVEAMIKNRNWGLRLSEVVIKTTYFEEDELKKSRVTTGGVCISSSRIRYTEKKIDYALIKNEGDPIHSLKKLIKNDIKYTQSRNGKFMKIIDVEESGQMDAIVDDIIRIFILFENNRERRETQTIDEKARTKLFKLLIDGDGIDSYVDQLKDYDGYKQDEYHVGLTDDEIYTFQTEVLSMALFTDHTKKLRELYDGGHFLLNGWNSVYTRYIEYVGITKPFLNFGLFEGILRFERYNTIKVARDKGISDARISVNGGQLPDVDRYTTTYLLYTHRVYRQRFEPFTKGEIQDVRRDFEFLGFKYDFVGDYTSGNLLDENDIKLNIDNAGETTLRRDERNRKDRETEDLKLTDTHPSPGGEGNDEVEVEEDEDDDDDDDDDDEGERVEE